MSKWLCLYCGRENWFHFKQEQHRHQINANGALTTIEEELWKLHPSGKYTGEIHICYTTSNLEQEEQCMVPAATCSLCRDKVECKRQGWAEQAVYSADANKNASGKDSVEQTTNRNTSKTSEGAIGSEEGEGYKEGQRKNKDGRLIKLNTKINGEKKIKDVRTNNRENVERNESMKGANGERKQTAEPRNGEMEKSRLQTSRETKTKAAEETRPNEVKKEGQLKARNNSFQKMEASKRDAKVEDVGVKAGLKTQKSLRWGFQNETTAEKPKYTSKAPEQSKVFPTNSHKKAGRTGGARVEDESKGNSKANKVQRVTSGENMRNENVELKTMEAKVRTEKKHVKIGAHKDEEKLEQKQRTKVTPKDIRQEKDKGNLEPEIKMCERIAKEESKASKEELEEMSTIKRHTDTKDHCKDLRERITKEGNKKAEKCTKRQNMNCIIWKPDNEDDKGDDARKTMTRQTTERENANSCASSEDKMKFKVYSEEGSQDAQDYYWETYKRERENSGSQKRKTNFSRRETLIPPEQVKKVCRDLNDGNREHSKEDRLQATKLSFPECSRGYWSVRLYVHHKCAHHHCCQHDEPQISKTSASEYATSSKESVAQHCSNRANTRNLVTSVNREGTEEGGAIWMWNGGWVKMFDCENRHRTESREINTSLNGNNDAQLALSCLPEENKAQSVAKWVMESKP